MRRLPADLAAAGAAGLGSMRRDRRGVAAMEFALIAPVLGVLVMGMIDVEQALVTQKRVADVAHQIAMMATEQAVEYQTNHSLVITPAEAQVSLSAIYAMMPELRHPSAGTRYNVTLSSIAFPKNAQGAFIPAVAWSVAMSNLNGKTADTLINNAPAAPFQRVCNVAPVEVAANQPVTLQNLPIANMVALAPILVVDVTYTYTPIFGRFVHPATGTITFSRTAMLMPRTFQPQSQVPVEPVLPIPIPIPIPLPGAGPGPQSQSAIYYNDPTNPTPAAVCPGYYYSQTS